MVLVGRSGGSFPPALPQQTPILDEAEEWEAARGARGALRMSCAKQGEPSPGPECFLQVHGVSHGRYSDAIRQIRWSETCR